MGQIGVNCQTYSQIGVRLFSHSNLVNFIVLIYGYTGRNYFEIIASLGATASSLKTPHLYVLQRLGRQRKKMEQTLSVPRSLHVAFLVPDGITECTLTN